MTTLVRTIEYEDKIDHVLDVRYEELQPGDSLESSLSAYAAQMIEEILPFRVRFSRSGWVNRAYIEMLPGSPIRIYRRVQGDL